MKTDSQNNFQAKLFTCTAFLLSAPQYPYYKSVIILYTSLQKLSIGSSHNAVYTTMPLQRSPSHGGIRGTNASVGTKKNLKSY
jgi:hypothetical protein